MQVEEWLDDNGIDIEDFFNDVEVEEDNAANVQVEEINVGNVHIKEVNATNVQVKRSHKYQKYLNYWEGFAEESHRESWS